MGLPQRELGFYAYTHSTPGGEVFYVGRGRGCRAYNFSARSAAHKRIVKRVGRENVVVTLYPVRNGMQAHAMEHHLISKHRLGGGLCNAVGALRGDEWAGRERWGGACAPS